MNNYYLGVLSGIGGASFLIGLSAICKNPIPSDVIFYIGIAFMLIGSIIKIKSARQRQKG